MKGVVGVVQGLGSAVSQDPRDGQDSNRSQRRKGWSVNVWASTVE